MGQGYRLHGVVERAVKSSPKASPRGIAIMGMRYPVSLGELRQLSRLELGFVSVKEGQNVQISIIFFLCQGRTHTMKSTAMVTGVTCL